MLEKHPSHESAHSSHSMRLLPREAGWWEVKPTPTPNANSAVRWRLGVSESPLGSSFAESLSPFPAPSHRAPCPSACPQGTPLCRHVCRAVGVEPKWCGVGTALDGTRCVLGNPQEDGGLSLCAVRQLQGSVCARRVPFYLCGPRALPQRSQGTKGPSRGSGLGVRPPRPQQQSLCWVVLGNRPSLESRALP